MKYVIMAIAAALLTCPIMAGAALVDVGFSGSFTSGPLVGDIFSGLLSYDTSLGPYSAPGLSPAQYQPVRSTIAIHDGADQILTGTNLGEVYNNTTDRTHAGVYDLFESYTDDVELRFSDANGTTLSGIGLPTLQQLEQFTLRDIYFQQGSSVSRGAFSLSAVPSVPESSTWAMMILGFGLIGTAMRSFRKSEEKFTGQLHGGAFA
jgi:hypothetical protein